MLREWLAPAPPAAPPHPPRPATPPYPLALPRPGPPLAQPNALTQLTGPNMHVLICVVHRFSSAYISQIHIHAVSDSICLSLLWAQ